MTFPEQLRPAVHAADDALFFQRFEIAPHGRFGHLQFIAQLGDRPDPRSQTAANQRFAFR